MGGVCGKESGDQAFAKGKDGRGQRRVNDLETIADDYLKTQDLQLKGPKGGGGYVYDEPHRNENMKIEDCEPESARDEASGMPESNQGVVRWQRGGLIGSGAFGKVYLGLNLETGELFAVKQVALGVDGERQTAEVESLEREIRLMRRLRHDNIVRYLGTSRDAHYLNIFLEYVPGGSIASLLQKFGRFSEQVIRVYSRQILQGLRYLHYHEIIHRDIKGANVLVSNQGKVKLADFGASRQLEAMRTTSVESIRGTPYWMAPEVIRQTGVTVKADIWSFGCTVLEMATGKPPWADFPDQVSVMFHIASSQEPPSIPEYLSENAHDFLHLCFQRDPLKRPSAVELLSHPFVRFDSSTGNSGGSLRTQASVTPAAAKTTSNQSQQQPQAAASTTTTRAKSGAWNATATNTLNAETAKTSNSDGPKVTPNRELRASSNTSNQVVKMPLTVETHSPPGATTSQDDQFGAVPRQPEVLTPHSVPKNE